MSNKTQFGENNRVERTYLAEAALTTGYYVVGGTEAGNVALPAAAAASNGKGIVLHDADSGDPVAVANGGIIHYRKASGIVAEGDPLTLAASPLGSLRKAVPGEPLYGVSCVDSTSTEEYGYCALIPGMGNLIVPREVYATLASVTLDAELTALAVPAGYRLHSLIARNTTSNAVTLKIGKTAGAQDVVAGVAVGASAIVDLTLLLTVFSFSSAQSLFASSANWNSADLTLYQITQRLI